MRLHGPDNVSLSLHISNDKYQNKTQIEDLINVNCYILFKFSETRYSTVEFLV